MNKIINCIFQTRLPHTHTQTHGEYLKTRSHIPREKNNCKWNPNPPGTHTHTHTHTHTNI